MGLAISLDLSEMAIQRFHRQLAQSHCLDSRPDHQTGRTTLQLTASARGIISEEDENGPRPVREQSNTSPRPGKPQEADFEAIGLAS